jgi:feruloyl esterase
MAVTSKAIITAYYKKGPRLSYWNGCSTGGRQGLMAAQRYPEDFDGIIAGAPANNQTHLCAWRIAVEATILQDGHRVRSTPPRRDDTARQAFQACRAVAGKSPTR